MLTVHGLVTVPTAADVLEVKHHNGEEIRGQKEYAISYDFGRGLVVTVGGDSSADENKNIASDANPHPLNLGQRDLLAQERMSHWTKYLGIFTGAGVVLLLFTLHETNETAKYARDMLDEQRRSDELTLRAYITIQVERTELSHRVVLIVKNVGQTPALNVLVKARAFSAKRQDLKKTFPAPAEWGFSKSDGIAIAPSADVRIPVDMTREDEKFIIDRERDFAVSAIVSYHDEWTYRANDDDEYRATRQYFVASRTDYLEDKPLTPVSTFSAIM